MKKLALLHTVQSVADTFGAYLREAFVQDVKLYNLWDQFLSLGPNDEGKFTIAHKRRLYQDLLSCEEVGADCIVVTCSTLTPHLSTIRSFLRVPVVAIDEAMLREAASHAGCVLLVATAASAIGSAKERILEEAQAFGVHLETICLVVGEAYQRMQQNDMTQHDLILKREVEQLAREKHVDCIVLCQASMAPCASDIERETGIRTLSSPALCRAQVKALLAGDENKHLCIHAKEEQYGKDA